MCGALEKAETAKLNLLRRILQRNDCTCKPGDILLGKPCRCKARLAEVNLSIEEWTALGLSLYPLLEEDADGQSRIHEDTYRQPPAPRGPRIASEDQDERVAILEERALRGEALWHGDERETEGETVNRKRPAYESAPLSLHKEILRILSRQLRPLHERLSDIDGEEKTQCLCPECRQIVALASAKLVIDHLPDERELKKQKRKVRA